MPLILLSQWGVTWPFQREYSSVRDFCFFSVIPTLLSLKHFTAGLGGGTEIGSQYKARHTLFPQWVLWFSRTFLGCRDISSPAEFINSISGSKDSHIHCQSIGMHASTLLIKILPRLCSWRYTGGGIFEMGKSINVSGNVLPYSFVCFMLDPFSSGFWWCHLSPQKAGASYGPFKICYLFLFLFFFLRSVRKCVSPRSHFPGPWHVKD